MSDGIKIRNMLLLDEDRQKEIKIGEDVFTIKAELQGDSIAIANSVAFLQNGLPANSFDNEARYRFKRNSTIDVLVVSGPDWWENATNCPDEEVLEDLFEEINKWSGDFQTALKKNRFVKRSEKTTVHN